MSRRDRVDEIIHQIITGSPDYLDSRKWYDRQCIVDALRQMKYSALIAQELADWFLLHIRSAFNRGIRSTVQHMLNEQDAKQGVSRWFQNRVEPWMMECFGGAISSDTVERNHRFLEESLELVQACGCTQSEAHQLVDYVFNRPVGEKLQEVGGVMVTLAALCLAHGINMHEAGDIELIRIWNKIDQIRAKQAAKPKHSPLPF